MVDTDFLRGPRQPVRLYIPARFPPFFFFLPFFFFSDGIFDNPDSPPFGEGHNQTSIANFTFNQPSAFISTSPPSTLGTPGLRDKRPFFPIFTIFTTSGSSHIHHY
jgi:hypothetical protein